MKDYVSSCFTTFTEDTSLVDINMLEENSGSPCLTLAVLPKSENIVLFQMDSRLHVDNLQNILESGKRGCSNIAAILQRTIKDSISEHAATLVI